MGTDRETLVARCFMRKTAGFWMTERCGVCPLTEESVEKRALCILARP